MDEGRRIWLVDNAASGSNSADALDDLGEACAGAGFHVVQRSTFPEEELPTAAMLDAAEVDLVAIFTGDGTINALVTQLAGWSGAILILPGGTMNLLYHRLHGERTFDEVVEAAATGKIRRVRPTVISGPGGDALAGLLAGPATSWADVREDMRDMAIGQLAEDAVEAVDHSISAPGVICTEPRLGLEGGYPLLMLNPASNGVEISAFHAETAADYVAQGLALLKRNFREGPHDDLGTLKELVIESVDGVPISILVDGEPAEAPAKSRFVLANCKVDLLATEPDDL